MAHWARGGNIDYQFTHCQAETAYLEQMSKIRSSVIGPNLQMTFNGVFIAASGKLTKIICKAAKLEWMVWFDATKRAQADQNPQKYFLKEAATIVAIIDGNWIILKVNMRPNIITIYDSQDGEQDAVRWNFWSSCTCWMRRLNGIRTESFWSLIRYINRISRSVT